MPNFTPPAEVLEFYSGFAEEIGALPGGRVRAPARHRAQALSRAPAALRNLLPNPFAARSDSFGPASPLRRYGVWGTLAAWPQRPAPAEVEQCSERASRPRRPP
jgi:hypothetical protein